MCSREERKALSNQFSLYRPPPPPSSEEEVAVAVQGPKKGNKEQGGGVENSFSPLSFS